jgi:recombination protein RecA
MSELQKTMDMLNKKSKGSVYKLGENPDVEVRRISSGRLSIDIPMGGGYPDGRIIEFYGGESSGKTTATLHSIASFQKQGFKCAFIDYEHAFDPSYARALGVDTDELIFSQPTTAEEGLDIINALVSTGELKLIIVDSVAAMTPKVELEGESGQSVIGVHARLMSQAMRKLASKTYKTHTDVVFINQLREKIGVMFGDPRTTTGGNALKFYASIRVEFSKGSKKKSGDEITHNQGRLKVVKNKTYKPYQESTFDMEFGTGISEVGELIDYGVAAGIINKAGSWYSYDDTKLGQGKDAVKTILDDNPELLETIKDQVLTVYFPTEEEEKILNEE